MSADGDYTWTQRGTLDQVSGINGADFEFDKLGRMASVTLVSADE